MELIDQHTKGIMEGCKERARDAGLRFQDETLEYIVTNRDLLELSPKQMIPTLYDYWVHDVRLLQERGKYELYPHNPYETVINTRPAVSFYNDNNPDWLNVMIFYHVLAHIDFFQNNLYFRNTWEDDFAGQALSDKRVIARLRSEKGRWVDYVIEFARGIDNLVGYHRELSRGHRRSVRRPNRVDFYFDVFLQETQKVSVADYVKEIERYNACRREQAHSAEDAFFSDVEKKFPEFHSVYEKHVKQKQAPCTDLMQHLLERSPKLRLEENRWMKTVLQVVRNTSLFFQPQIRTKIMNEGWASFWHELLFLDDDRIRGHEVDFARVNAAVTSLSRIGLNPYALGMRLFAAIEETVDKGKLSYAYQRLQDTRLRQQYDTKAGGGRAFIFAVRENFCDFTFVRTFLDQDFVDHHQLFVAGRRLNREKGVWEYFIRSRKALDYRHMVEAELYHPPRIEIESDKCREPELYLNHVFEGRPLVKEYIHNTLLGIEFLWGAAVHLETTEAVPAPGAESGQVDERASIYAEEAEVTPKFRWERVVYTVQKRKMTRRVL
ncbi:MAG: SpoVR family protein [Desulfobacteraceae bacterium]|nr:SpoVR family protein [Desulfobacteraceae bacterium]